MDVGRFMCNAIREEKMWGRGVVDQIENVLIFKLLPVCRVFTMIVRFEGKKRISPWWVIKKCVSSRDVHLPPRDREILHLPERENVRKIKKTT